METTMLSSRSQPQGRRSYSEELEIIQRKRIARLQKQAGCSPVEKTRSPVVRRPVRPEGPRMSEMPHTESRSPEQIEPRSPGKTCRAAEQTHRSPVQAQQAPEVRHSVKQTLRAPEQSQRASRVPRSTQSMPERSMSPPGMKGVDVPKSNVDPWGRSSAAKAKASRSQTLRNQVARADSSKAESSKAESTTAKKPTMDSTKKEILLRQQMRQQIDKQQNREQQVQRERAVLEQKLIKARRKKAPSKQLDCYDQYTGAESTSGYSRYGDKYEVDSKSKQGIALPTDPRIKIEARPQTGAQMGTGQFATNVGMVAAGNAISSPKDIVVAETCTDDFLHSMMMPPAPPTDQEQQMITTGMRSMALASEKAVENDDCGAFLMMDDEPALPLEVKGTDWYGKRQHPVTQESFFGDFIHSLWTCS